jgi:predicted PurR-regulated permease PerM
MKNNSSGNIQNILPPPWISVILILTGLTWIIVKLRELCFFLLLAYLISYLIHPSVSWLEQKKGVPRWMGCIGVVGGVCLVALLLLLSVLPYILNEVIRLIQHLPSSFSQAQEVITNSLKNIPFINHLPWDQLITGSKISEFLKSRLINDGTLKTVTAALGSALLGGYSFGMTVINLALLPFFVFYITIDFIPLHKNALLTIPSRYRPKVTQIITKINKIIREFLTGQIIVGAILSVLYLVGLQIVGLQLSAAISIISGFGNLVPYLGGILGAFLATLISISSVGSLGHVLGVWTVFIVVQLLESFLITPKIVGDQVGVSPLTVSIALIAGGTLFGLLGIMIAVPATAALKILLWELLVYLKADVTLATDANKK